MDNTPGMSLVPVREYLEFPDMSFFEEECFASQERYERLMGTDELFAQTMGAISALGAQGKPSPHFIIKANELYNSYIQENDLETDSKLYDTIENFLLRELIIHKSILPKLGEENNIGKFRSIESEKDLQMKVKKLDELIVFFERILDDIKNRNDIVFLERKEQYEQRKKQILEGEQQKVDTEVISPVPNLPVLPQNTLPAKRGVNFQIRDLLSLGTNWEELDRKVREFSEELTDNVKSIPENIASNDDFFEKRVREIFGELKNKYKFPKGFDVSISTEEEVNPEKEEDRYRSTPTYKKKPINKFHSGKIEVYFTLKFPEEIPAWISRSFSFQYPHFYLCDFSGQNAFRMHFGDYGERRTERDQMNSIGEQLPFMIQLSQKSKQLRSVTKIRERIENDPVLDFLYYQIKHNSSEYMFDHLDENAENLELIWKNRRELKQAVQWLGFHNIEIACRRREMITFNQLMKVLEENKYSFLPIPHNKKPEKYTGYRHEYEDGQYMVYSGLTIGGDPINVAFYDESPESVKLGLDIIIDKDIQQKIEDDFYKNNRADIGELFRDLEYYFKIKKHEEFYIRVFTPKTGQELSKYRTESKVLELNVINLDGPYNEIRVTEFHGRLKISIFKDGEEINDLNNQAEAQKIIWKALQKVEKTSESGKKK